MKLETSSFDDGGVIPDEFAFCVPDPEQHATFGPNRNPAFSWSGVPEGTKSFALVCHDPDVPSKPDNVNKEGVTVSKDLPRVNFYHWALIDLPADTRSIEAGAWSEGVTAQGKDGSGPAGRQGKNNYTDWFAGDPDMGGDYLGYDGPCPPWNDEIIHHYHFTLYALDVATLDLPQGFGGPEVEAAVAGHTLAKASVVGTFTLNPDLR